MLRMLVALRGLSLLHGLLQAKAKHKESDSFLPLPFSTQENRERETFESPLSERLPRETASKMPSIPSSLVPRDLRPLKGPLRSPFPTITQVI